MIWIAIAALLWSTDTIFRYTLVQSIDTPTLVLFEHVVSTFFLLPALWKSRSVFRTLGPRHWFELIWIGVGGSALATLLFTEAFRYLNPTLVILLQKLQPLFALSLAALLLGERRSRSFILWAGFALLGALGLQWEGGAVKLMTENPWALLLPIGAAFLWGSSTVFSKSVSSALKPNALAGARLAIGTLFLLVLHAVSEDLDFLKPFTEGADWRWIPTVVLMSLVSGLLALQLYYKGIQTTLASTATILELIFPLSATFLNAVLLGFWLTPAQLFSALILLVAITRIALLESKQK